MSATMGRRPGLATFVVASALALVGCSQVSALAPVSGVPLATVRTASYDVLTANDVRILTAPLCTEDATTITCKGTTVGGQPIDVVAPTATPLQMTVTVAGRELYKGPVQDVLDTAAQR